MFRPTTNTLHDNNTYILLPSTPYMARSIVLCRLPISLQQLSHWVSKQRHDFKLRKQGKSSRLNDRKLKLLNDVGFLWEGSRRSLKDKISVGTSDAESEDNSMDQPALVATSTVMAHQGQGGVMPPVASTQAILNMAVNPAAFAVPGIAATGAANPQTGQQALTPDNIAQLLRSLTGSSQQQQQQQQLHVGSGAAMQMAPSLFSLPSATTNAAGAPAAQPSGYADPGGINHVLNLVSQLITPGMQQQQPQQQLHLQAAQSQFQPQPRHRMSRVSATLLEEFGSRFHYFHECPSSISICAACQSLLSPGKDETDS